jgi:hypothetical protein
MAAVLTRTGPVALTTNLATNIYNPAGNEEMRLIHVANKTANSATFTLYLGASLGNVAGTELFFKQVVGAFGAFDFPYPIKLTSADFLVGGSDTATALTVTLTTAKVPV